jgi:hypothetical protein
MVIIILIIILINYKIIFLYIYYNYLINYMMYKYLNLKEGYQNNNHIFSSDYFGKNKDNTEYSFIDVKNKCLENNKDYLYDTLIPLIKKDAVRRRLLKKYITRLENGETVCWRLPNYTTCKRIEKIEKEDPNNLTEQQKQILNNVCKNEINCIGENMIKKYNEELNNSDLDTLIKKGKELSINTKGKNKDTLIKEIIDKNILSNILEELILHTNKNRSITLLDNTEKRIIDNKKRLCTNVNYRGCDLDKHVCDDIHSAKVSNTLSKSSRSIMNSNVEDRNNKKKRNIIIGATIGGIVLIAIIVFIGFKKYKIYKI